MMHSISSSRDTWDEEFIWQRKCSFRENFMMMRMMDLSRHAVCVVHGLHAAAVDALDVDLLLAGGEALQTLAVVGQVCHRVVCWGGERGGHI